MKFLAMNGKRWDCIALLDDIDSCDEAEFRMQIRQLALTSLELLNAAIFDKECEPRILHEPGILQPKIDNRPTNASSVTARSVIDHVRLRLRYNVMIEQVGVRNSESQVQLPPPPAQVQVTPHPTQAQAPPPAPRPNIPRPKGSA
ncbi:hypothetical protein LguiB_019490 [Lonicera macranthoides]